MSVLEQRWVDAPFCVFDLEMTGLDRSKDRICEIGVVRSLGPTLNSRWSALVNPEMRVSARARNVHGLDRDLLRKQPRFCEIANEVKAQLQDGLLVAHNLPFDLAYLNPELARAGRLPCEGPSLDTLELARRLFTFRENRLDVLCEELNVPRGQAHRALGDAEATWAVLIRMLTLLDPHGERTVGEIVQLLADRAPGSPKRREEREQVTHAHKARRPIQLGYLSRSGEGPRTVHARRVEVWRVGRKKFQGYCHLRQAERIFHFERVEHVSVLEGTYDIPRHRSRVS
ncbi:MAG: exonuclease domain-containing protein [Myxococcota bacterium]